MDIQIIIPSTVPNPSAPAYQFKGMHSPSNDDSSTISSRVSSPLTDMSRSPTPPSAFYDYPSPMSSQLSSVPSSSTTSPAPESREDGSPPKKRRRTSYEPKPRTTKHLHFQDKEISATDKESLDLLMKAVHNRRKIVVIAGAGISVSAGSKSWHQIVAYVTRSDLQLSVPDFRSSKGLFKSLKKQHGLKSSGKDLFDASVYKDGDSTTSFHQMVRQLSTMAKDAKATPFHHMLATLADEGRLLRLYSQNVDGIDTALPPLETTVPLNRKGPWPKTIQLHGGLQKMVCSKCNDMKDLDAALFDGPETPTCNLCIAADNARTEYAGKRSHGVGRLRPRMVLYNEHNPDDEAIGAVVKSDMRTRPDCLIVVGTTLKIPGVKRIVKEMGAIVRGRRDGLTIWVNMDGPPPSKDYEWDLIVKGPCDKIADHAAMRKWHEPRAETITKEQADAIKAQSIISVIIPSPAPSRIRDAEDSMPTPATSRSTSVPPGKPVAKKLTFILDGNTKSKATAKAKPAPKATKKPAKPKSNVKFVKRAPNKQSGPPVQKLAFGISKASKAEIKSSAKKEAQVQVNQKPAAPVPMRVVSPVDAKFNAQTVAKMLQDPRLLGERLSPTFSPVTPRQQKFENAEPRPTKDVDHAEPVLTKRKLSVDFMLNHAQPA